ncbi:TPA: hypothetical protein I8273_002874 [Aeromonas hydrophila]|nr:hypothetical protein [Aeromonas hydrophila]HAT2383823.1 hypothetical protein [Aeromonas hydrophila]HAT2415866.1 hypothetical protein [Aeromonas hydrophila]HAT2575469.1 hypothetical protein [Aeromonas hydrophila]HAT2578881.1 hypothetical protein [Aeromonas hydrophila]
MTTATSVVPRNKHPIKVLGVQSYPQVELHAAVFEHVGVDYNRYQLHSTAANKSSEKFKTRGENQS